jgi:protein-tyrosine-phosphatase
MTTARTPTILFACVHNAGRSQMAAALAKMIAGDRVDVRSGGSEPADAVHPNVRAVMAELGIDLAGECPKRITDGAVREADAVITMGCGDACPFYPGKRYEDWQIDDPAGATLAQTRRIRGLLRLRVERLLRDLGVLSPTSSA